MDSNLFMDLDTEFLLGLIQFDIIYLYGISYIDNMWIKSSVQSYFFKKVRQNRNNFVVNRYFFINKNFRRQPLGMATNRGYLEDTASINSKNTAF